MMRSEGVVTKHAFATLRIAGDELHPDEVTKVLKFKPTTAYAKGQKYAGSSPDRSYRGKTGVWFLSTDAHVTSEDLEDHLHFLVGLLIQRRFYVGVKGGKPYARVLPDHATPTLTAFRNLLAEKSLRAVVTCFWYGSAGSPPPAIPDHLSMSIRSIPAELEVDFETDAESEIRADARREHH